MDINDIKQQREKARRAMMKNSGNLDQVGAKNFQSSPVTSEDLAQKRAEARKAMESETHKKQREQLEASLNAQKKYTENVLEIKRKREQLEKEQAQKLKRQTEAQRLEEIKKIEAGRKKALEADLQIKDIKEKEVTLSPLKTPSLDTVSDTDLASNLTTSTEIKSESVKKSNVRILVIFFIIILVITSIGLLYLVSQKVVTIQTGVEVEQVPALIPVQSNVEIVIDNKTPQNITNEIKSFLRPNITGGSLTQIYFTITKTKENDEVKERLSALDFLTALNLDLPANFIHFLQPGFMVATLNSPQAETNLIYVLTTRSFEHTYDTLLKNENEITKALYENFLNPETTTYLQQTNFTDTIINNVDTRGVYTEERELIVLYAFLNQELLIFAQSEASFNALLNAYRKN